MLLKSISAVNSRGHILNLPLNDPSGGFSVRDIQGLGPVKANVASSKFASLDGEEYHASSRGIRNIIIKLGLNPDYGQESVHSLRTQLYAYFMPKSETKLKFELYDKFTDTTLNVEIDGVVETSEPSIFTKDPEITVSVLCHQPDFIDPTVITVNGVSQNTEVYVDVDYVGTADTGVIFTLTADRALAPVVYSYGFEFAQVRPDGIIDKVQYTEDLAINDEVVVNTAPGNKSVMFQAGSGGFPVTKMYALGDLSDWVILRPGLNRFLVFAGDGEVGVPWSFDYITRYGGL